jgi:hypothetical protein
VPPRTKLSRTKGQQGIQSIVDYCQNIEQQITENPTPHLNELLTGFEKVWQATELAIDEFIANDTKKQ